MKKLKLGIIGLSEGNGHPYSWSAIINGYDSFLMKQCPFPMIPKYLAKENFPEAQIKEANVTHIWTQDLDLSQQIATTTFIPKIVSKMEDMIPEIDAVLLARDDAENHFEMAKPFIEAGLPIYIDKPLAFTLDEAERLYSLEKFPGQIFTCSAFQFARELLEIKTFKKITHIEAFIKNDWKKYAIHLIEPILKIAGHDHLIKYVNIENNLSDKSVDYIFSNDLKINIKTSMIKMVKPTIHFFHENGSTLIVFQDIFFAFKSTLEKFIESAKDKKPIIKKDFVMRAVEMIGLGI